jgi:hypothetical protein
MAQGDEQKAEEVSNGAPKDPASEVEHAAGSGTSKTTTTNGQKDAATTVPTTTSSPEAQPGLAQTATGSLSTTQKAGVETIAAASDQLRNADTNKPEEMAAATNKQLLGYYINGLKQSSNSFWAALAAAIAGVVFFILAVAFLLFTEAQDISVVTAIAGAVVEVIAGLVFYLYGKTTDQLDGYRTGMERTQRFLLANSIALSINEPDSQQKTLATLVETISQWGQPASRNGDDKNKRSNGASRQRSSRDKDSRQPDQ